MDKERDSRQLRQEISRLENRLQELDNERVAIGEQLKTLKALLDKDLTFEETRRLTNSEKLTIFRELFKGREDVFAKRWENTETGRAGYAPARINQAYLPLTDDILKKHLMGHFVIGVYPLLKDETCHFLAADFDKNDWAEDVAAFVKSCVDWAIPCAVERSRSGNGAQLTVFLNLDTDDIGQVGGGKNIPLGRIDVAMIQSLVKRSDVEEFLSGYGQVIVDECHHIPAVSFEGVLRTCQSRFMCGLTATPKRRDGLHPIVTFQMGPIRHTISAKDLATDRSFIHRLIVRETDFVLPHENTDCSIQELRRLLTHDDARNNLITDDVGLALEEGRTPIVLTERLDHLEILAAK